MPGIQTSRLRVRYVTLHRPSRGPGYLRYIETRTRKSEEKREARHKHRYLGHKCKRKITWPHNRECCVATFPHRSPFGCGWCETIHSSQGSLSFVVSLVLCSGSHAHWREQERRRTLVKLIFRNRTTSTIEPQINVLASNRYSVRVASDKKRILPYLSAVRN